MRIHYYMQYFPGVNASGTIQPVTLSRFLAERGHEVTVISSHTNIDTGLREESVNLSFSKDGRLRVLRLPCLSGGRGSNIDRLKAYLSFMTIAKIRGLLLPRPNVIIGSIQPPFTGLAALAVARVKRSPFVLEVRDLWPDALVVKKAINVLEAKPLFTMANFLYGAADRIVSITPGIKKELVKKGISGSCIDVFPNGFDPELFQNSDKKRGEVRIRYGWGDDFVAIYTGSFTQVTAIDVIVRAAVRLKENRRIRFALFGNGPTRKGVEELARKLGGHNISFYDPVPKTEIPGLLAAADAALMSLFSTPLAHIYFENKFMDYMGAGKPIFAAMDGEQAEIIRQYGVGRVVSPGDALGLSQIVLNASQDVSARREMGDYGQLLVNRSLLLPSILKHYTEVLEILGGRESKTITAWEPIF